MTPPSFEQFSDLAKAQGYQEVLERHWAAGTVLDTHTHDFEAHAIVVQGEMWLTVGGEVQHLQPGDRFFLHRQQPHAERYGAEGATYWVARRGPA